MKKFLLTMVLLGLVGCNSGPRFTEHIECVLLDEGEIILHKEWTLTKKHSDRKSRVNTNGAFVYGTNSVLVARLGPEWACVVRFEFLDQNEY